MSNNSSCFVLADLFCLDHSLCMYSHIIAPAADNADNALFLYMKHVLSFGLRRSPATNCARFSRSGTDASYDASDSLSLIMLVNRVDMGAVWDV